MSYRKSCLANLELQDYVYKYWTDLIRHNFSLPEYFMEASENILYATHYQFVIFFLYEQWTYKHKGIFNVQSSKIYLLGTICIIISQY